MSANILLGPILGFEEGDFYTVCFLSDPLPEKVKLQLKMGVLAAPVDFKEAGRVGGKVFWRAEFTLSVPAKGSQASYAIELNGKPMPESITKGQPIAQLQGAQLSCLAPQWEFKKGGQGVWGQVPMPPNATVPDADLKALVKWVLSVK